MNTSLLVLLNLQTAAILGYCVLERGQALRYRADALGKFGSIDDSTLATWARVAGKTRLDDALLEEARSGAVVASGRDQHQDRAEGRSDSVVEISHPSIVQSGADV